MAVRDCRFLQQGDRGPDVKAYQQAANVWLIHQQRLGITSCDGLTRPELLVEDGIYGPKTEGVTRWLQCRFGLKQDGYAGEQTLGALSRHLANAGLGVLALGVSVNGTPPSPGCVVPITYIPTDLANQYRLEHGLPAIVAPGDGGAGDSSGTERPKPSPLARIPVWLIGLGALLALWRWRRR